MGTPAGAPDPRLSRGAGQAWCSDAERATVSGPLQGFLPTSTNSLASISSAQLADWREFLSHSTCSVATLWSAASGQDVCVPTNWVLGWDPQRRSWAWGLHGDTPLEFRHPSGFLPMLHPSSQSKGKGQH